MASDAVLMGLAWRIELTAVLALAACGAPATQLPSLRAPAPPAIAVAAAPTDATLAPVPVVSDETREHATERARRRVARAATVAYMLTPTVTRLDLLVTAEATVTCAIEVRVSPINSRGEERWDAGTSATAVGRAIVTSSASPGEVEQSIDVCVDSAADQVVVRRVAPFLARSIAVR